MQGKDSLPLPKLEGDDRSQARALATLYSHPVVSFESTTQLLYWHICIIASNNLGLSKEVV